MRSAVRAVFVLVVALGLGACNDGVPHESARSIIPGPAGASPVAPPPPLARPPQPANLVVHGVGMGEHRRSFAVISAGSAPPAIVEAGDAVGEERLLQIGDDFVVVEAQGTTRKIWVGGTVKPVGPTVTIEKKVASSPAATPDAEDLRSNRAFEAFLSKSTAAVR